MMTLAYIIKLDFMTQKININIQKIDNLTLATYVIVIVGFVHHDKQK